MQINDEKQTKSMQRILQNMILNEQSISLAFEECSFHL